MSAAAEQGNSMRLDAVYSRLGDRVSQEEALALAQWANSRGVNLREAGQKMHAKVLAWDTDNLLISSFNLLSADPGENEPRQELGLLIEHSNAAQTMISDFDSTFSATGESGEFYK